MMFPNLCFRSVPVVLESALTEYVQWAFDSGQEFWKAKYAVVGAQWLFRHAKGRIRRAWDSLKTWEDSRPSSHRVPLPRIARVASLVYAIGLAADDKVCKAS